MASRHVPKAVTCHACGDTAGASRSRTFYKFFAEPMYAGRAATGKRILCPTCLRDVMAHIDKRKVDAMDLASRSG